MKSLSSFKRLVKRLVKPGRRSKYIAIEDPGDDTKASTEKAGPDILPKEPKAMTPSEELEERNRWLRNVSLELSNHTCIRMVNSDFHF